MDLQPVNDELLPDFCEFVARNMKRRSAADVAHVYGYGWLDEKPNYGFVLCDSGEIVGAIGAIYSERSREGRTLRFCNIADWYVAPEFRSESLELLFAVLTQPGYVFTALTSTKPVTQILRSFGFKVIDPHKVAVFTAPHALRAALGPRRVVTDLEAIRARLCGDELAIFDDLSDARSCHHLLLSGDSVTSYCILRFERRRGLKFAVPLHVGEPSSLMSHLGPLSWWMLTQHRTMLLLAEAHLWKRRPFLSLRVSDPRPPLFSSRTVPAEHVDSLYSELTR